MRCWQVEKAWMRCFSETGVCVKLHKFSLSCLPWTDRDKQLAGAFLQSPVIHPEEVLKIRPEKATGNFGSLYGYTEKDQQSW